MKVTPRLLPEVPKIRSLVPSPDGGSLSLAVEVLDNAVFRRALWSVPADGSRAPSEVDVGGLEVSELAYLADGSLLFCSSAPEPSAEPGARSVYLLAPGGERPRCLLTVPGGISAMEVATGGTVLLRAWMFPRASTLAEDAAIGAARAEAGADAVLFEELETRDEGRLFGPRLPRLLRFDVGAPDVQDDLTPHAGSGLVESDQAISPDGRRIVTSWKRVAAHGFRDYSLELIDGSGQRTVAVDGQFTLPSISPDGRLVVAEKLNVGTPERAERISLWLVDLDSKEGFDLSGDFPLWTDVPFWSPDSRFVYFVADERGHAPIFRVDVETRRIEKVADGSYAPLYTGARPCAAPVDDTLFAVRYSYDDVPRLVRIDVAPERSRITTLPFFGDDVELRGTASEMTCRTTDDVEIHSHLVMPEGASADAPVPLVLWSHGGPRGWNAQNFWLRCPYVLAERGYAVLMVNPARSTGYGQALLQRGWSDYGAHIPDDLLAAVDEAVKRPDVDGDKLAAMGHSFGGYMVNWLAGRTQRFKAIVCSEGVWSWDLDQGVSAKPTMWEEELGDPYEHPENWARNSPKKDLAHVRTPVLLIHGGKSDLVPQALQEWTDLKRHDVPAKFLYMPEEGHFLNRKPSDVVLYYETVLSFLDHYVLGRPWVQPELLG
ncbi:MAG TPA: alpha/beta fold hydrolase [Acidimicrobiales bacterium]|nr:alpha/beta fold hydrolase [Acidimicrobiales bacterium]